MVSELREWLPGGLSRALSKDDLVNLVAYLSSLKAK